MITMTLRSTLPFGLLSLTLATASCATQEPSSAAAIEDALVQSPDRADLEPGCTFRVYQSDFALERVLEPQQDQSPNVDERRSGVNCTGPDDFGGLEDNYVVQVTAWLDVTEPGMYLFRTTSDDGSFLELDGRRVLWNSGLHAPQSRDGAMQLQLGLHALRLLMFEALGGEYLTLEWQPPGAEDFALIPESALLTERGVTRVVAPGPKLFLEQLGDLRPGDGLPLERVHPGWRVEDLRPEGFEPQVGGLGWLPDGRLGVLSFPPMNDQSADRTPVGKLYALGGLGDDPEATSVLVAAEGLDVPLGMVTHEGKVYVGERDGIYRLEDRDGDGVFETRELFASGWASDNYHHFTFGPVLGRGADGTGVALHASLSTSIGSGGEDPRSGAVIGANGPNPANRGSWMRISLEEGLSPQERVEYLAGGFRTPNGILPLADGTALIADNQGAWKPANRIDHARPGHFYGHYNETRVVTEAYPEGGVAALYSDHAPSAPALWLPQNESNSSPTEMLLIPGGPFKDQILIGELKQGGIRRACFETVDGVMQGTVFRFTQGFEGGVNRLLWGDDGSLIVGMTGETATWSWRGTTFGLQRLVPTGETAFEFLKVQVVRGGLKITFTEPADLEQLADVNNYQAMQWGYRATADYGGSKRDVQPVFVKSATPFPDGLSVVLELEGMRSDRVMHVRAQVESAAGEPLWSPEFWTTVNRTLESSTAPADLGSDVLVFSKTAGFRHGSIPDGIEALERIGAELGMDVVATEDSEVFHDDSLQQFGAVVFLSTTGDILDLAQEAALRRWIERGGGFMGVHAAADTEYDWPYYRELVGALFSRHPAIQKANVEVLDGEHPATAGLPSLWERTDEWYDYQTLPLEGFRTLMQLDETSYEGGGMAPELGSHPIAWAREIEGTDGRSGARLFYTGGGHTTESFSETLFVQHLTGALAWISRLR